VAGYPINAGNWQSGLSMTDFIDCISTHKNAMRRRYDKVCKAIEKCQEFIGFDKKIFIVVMTEEWCTDCLMNLPILARIADVAPSMVLRIFIRKDWPELRAYYTEREIHSIPVATFMDEYFNILGNWVERPQAAHKRLSEWKAAHPEIEEIRRRFDLSAEQKRGMLKEINDQLLVEMESWYDSGLQNETIKEVADLLGVTQVN
jgi:hypothetical protein